MELIEINPDIAIAETLPASFYTGDDYFEASKERIFSKTWQFAGLRSDLANVMPVKLLDPMLCEPLLIADDGVTRCFSNVCTHRANILIENKCRIDSIRCGYHGRRFDLRGRCVSMPEFEGVMNFPSANDDLKEVSLAEWAGLFFVSLEPSGEFADYFEPILKRFGDFGTGADFFTTEYQINAHWALYCENFLEGFHIPYIHGSLNKELDFSTYQTKVFRYSSLQTAKETNGEADTAAYYYFVFPNLMFNFYPWGLSMNIVEPISKDQTRIRYITMVTDSSERDKGAGADLETVELEDQRIVESVQAGVRSRIYNRGRYSVRRETGIHHFHRLISEFINFEN